MTVYDLIPKQFKPMPATRRFVYEELLDEKRGVYVDASLVGWRAREAGVFSGKTSDSAWGCRHLKKLVELGLAYQLWHRSYASLDDDWRPEHRDNLRPYWWPEEKFRMPKSIQNAMWEYHDKGLA